MYRKVCRKLWSPAPGRASVGPPWGHPTGGCVCAVYARGRAAQVLRAPHLFQPHPASVGVVLHSAFWELACRVRQRVPTPVATAPAGLARHLGSTGWFWGLLSRIPGGNGFLTASSSDKGGQQYMTPVCPQGPRAAVPSSAPTRTRLLLPTLFLIVLHSLQLGKFPLGQHLSPLRYLQAEQVLGSFKRAKQRGGLVAGGL